MLPTQLHKRRARVLQLIEANDWYALIANAECTMTLRCPLTAWALIELEDGKQDVVGLIPLDELGGEVGVAPWTDFFVGYLKEGESLPSDMDNRLDVVCNPKI